MTRLVAVGGLLAGCGDPQPPPEQTHVNHDLPGVAPLPDTRVSCAPTANALRFACTVDLVRPSAVTLRWKRSDGALARETVSSVPELHHEIGLYFLTPDAEWYVDAVPTDPTLGTARTVVLTVDPPTGAEVGFVDTTGTPPASLVGMVSPCGIGAYVVIVDPVTNETVWYENFGSDLVAYVDAVTFTEDHTVLAIAEDHVLEADLHGNRRLDVELPLHVHHDLFRKDGLTRVLFKETVTVADSGYLMDGFYVLDAVGEIVREWHLVDHVSPKGEPGSLAQDWSHANAIWVDDRQGVVLSFRHLSAVARVDDDPGSATFGALNWRLAPPGSDLGSDFVLGSAVGPPADFQQQHGAHFDTDGSLLLFDNRIAGDSRALRIRLEPEAAVAEIVEAWPLPNHCDFQGSAYVTSGGGLLATCAPTRTAYEFDLVGGGLRWSGVASCSFGIGGIVPRIVPLDW